MDAEQKREYWEEQLAVADRYRATALSNLARLTIHLVPDSNVIELPVRQEPEDIVA